MIYIAKTLAKSEAPGICAEAPGTNPSGNPVIELLRACHHG